MRVGKAKRERRQRRLARQRRYDERSGLADFRERCQRYMLGHAPPPRPSLSDAVFDEMGAFTAEHAQLINHLGYLGCPADPLGECRPSMDNPQVCASCDGPMPYARPLSAAEKLPGDGFLQSCVSCGTPTEAVVCNECAWALGG